MIMQDAVLSLLLAMDVFMTKKGQDPSSRRELINSINKITEENSLDAIFVNNVDNFNIPDVVVLPLYHKSFSSFMMDGDLTNTCPYGYTIEIHSRCFEKFTPEELTAVVLHDILQNVQSCVAKERFIKAYNSVLSEYTNDTILSMFDEISANEVMFIAYADICSRPFRVPISTENTSPISTDDILKGIKLADAYDSYLGKVISLDKSQSAIEEMIIQDTKKDYRIMKTIFQACLDKDIRHYYTVVKTGVPLVSFEQIFSDKDTISSLGFNSKKIDYKRKITPVTTVDISSPFADDGTTSAAIVESFINPKSEVELRFQVDKIITEMRYAESEAEREVIMIKIKNLTLKLVKALKEVDKKLEKNPTDVNVQRQKETIKNLIDELEMLRDRVVKMDIKLKRYGVWVNWPENYTESPDYTPEVSYIYN